MDYRKRPTKADKEWDGCVTKDGCYWAHRKLLVFNGPSSISMSSSFFLFSTVSLVMVPISFLVLSHLVFMFYYGKNTKKCLKLEMMSIISINMYLVIESNIWKPERPPWELTMSHMCWWQFPVYINSLLSIYERTLMLRRKKLRESADVSESSLAINYRENYNWFSEVCPWDL